MGEGGYTEAIDMGLFHAEAVQRMPFLELDFNFCIEFSIENQIEL